MTRDLKPILDMLIAHRKATLGKWEAGIAGNANLVSFDGDDIRPIACLEVNANNHAAICASHNAIPTLLDLFRENPLRCESPIQYHPGHFLTMNPMLVPCGTCTSCQINAEVAR